ncbi:MAG: hypothetical protein LBF67_09350 [Prevotellaceae bacterium]|jgi:hypothetical protein|nr:hypothetical protein [Prevotellaceae bacterium]
MKKNAAITAVMWTVFLPVMLLLVISFAVTSERIPKKLRPWVMVAYLVSSCALATLPLLHFDVNHAMYLAAAGTLLLWALPVVARDPKILEHEMRVRKKPTSIPPGFYWEAY